MARPWVVKFSVLHSSADRRRDRHRIAVFRLNSKDPDVRGLYIENFPFENCDCGRQKQIFFIIQITKMRSYRPLNRRMKFIVRHDDNTPGDGYAIMVGMLVATKIFCYAITNEVRDFIW
jgi:hypothetical protein